MGPAFGARLRELMERRGISFRALAARTYYGKSYLHDVATGRKPPTPDLAAALDLALATGGELSSLVTWAGDALELAQRVAATDVSDRTLEGLECTFDDLASRYATSPPPAVLPDVLRRLGQVARLLDARKTLAQHHRLMVLGAWLSLLGATLHIDLGERSVALVRLGTARHLAAEAGDADIQAWCLETAAWDALTEGDFRGAVDLSRQAQSVAPATSSVLIQATAQEGRAWARMHDRVETARTLHRVGRMVSNLERPERPEHHYRYDPDKALAYTATTLAWAGDAAAEGYARAVIPQLEGRPRRVALAQLDLGLALLAADKLDEAAHITVVALGSGRIVPSNWWRATEIVDRVEASGIAEATDLREVYESFRS